MTIPIVSDNNRTSTVAERHREAYTRRAARASWRARLQAAALPALVGLALGGTLMGLAAWRVMPIEATAVNRVFADVDGDGALDFIVSGWVVYGPKAPGQ